MSVNQTSNAAWYKNVPKWNEIIHEEGPSHPVTAPVHIVKPETGKIAVVRDPKAHTAPRHNRRDMIATMLK